MHFDMMTMFSKSLSSIHRRFPKMNRIRFVIDVLPSETDESSAFVQQLREHVRDHLVWEGCQNVLIMDVAGEVVV